MASPWHSNFRNYQQLPDTKVVRTAFFIKTAAIAVVLGLMLWLGFREYHIYDLRIQIAESQKEIDTHARANREALRLNKAFSVEAKKIEEAKKLAEDKAKAAKQAKLEAKKQAVQKEQLAKKEAVLAAVQRKENLERQNALLGATGGAQASGAALKASGPSATYGSKVRAKVKPNIIFTEDIAGNPVAEVEVRTTLDGTIISQRLVKTSGNKAWDEAVIKAIIRTETMPRDTDGRVPTPMIIEFRPKD